MQVYLCEDWGGGGGGVMTNYYEGLIGINFYWFEELLSFCNLDEHSHLQDVI